MGFSQCDGLEIPLRCDLEAGQWIDDFLIEDKLGAGTFGIVYKTKKKNTSNNVALKLLKLWEVPFQQERTKVVHRFEREFKCGQIRSEYLVKSYEFGCHQGNPYLVMEYCPNGSLSKYIKRLPTLEVVNEIAHDILLGLRDLHKNGIYHRDIKPENILFTANDRVKLTDFGIAGFKQQRLTITNIFGNTKNIFGTWAYIAPEQADNKRAFKSMNAITDIFSFGVMMYELFSGGKYPFGSLNSHVDLTNYIQRARMGNWDSILEHNANLPSYWKQIIEGCLHPDYEQKRFQNVKEILELLGYHFQPSISPISKIKDNYLLKIMYGEDVGKTYNLTKLLGKPEGILTLGWFDKHLPTKNHIGVVETTTAFISNFHATIEKTQSPNCWYIRDGQWREKEGKVGWYLSKNGVFVNSKRIDTSGVKLKPNDIIIIGDTTLKFEIG